MRTYTRTIPMATNSTMLPETSRMLRLRQVPFKKRKVSRISNPFRFGKASRSREPVIELPSFSLLGGNRRDPLNLNELIRRSQQSTVDLRGNDRLVEIILPPNIFDPLCLDSSSRHRVDISSLNSRNAHSGNQDELNSDYQRHCWPVKNDESDDRTKHQSDVHVWQNRRYQRSMHTNELHPQLSSWGRNISSFLVINFFLLFSYIYAFFSFL